MTKERLHQVGSLVVQLREQRAHYDARKTEIREELRRLNAELAKIEEAEDAVHRLLLVEAPEEELKEIFRPAEVEYSRVAFPSNKAFVEAALVVLQEAAVPIYYHELTQKVRERGLVVPGKNPAQNLYAHLRRDPRFRLTGPGTFGLRPQVNGVFVDELGASSLTKAGSGLPTTPTRPRAVKRHRRGKRRQSK